MGREFTTLADLNGQLEAWLASVANVRIHGTTRERPVDRYAREVTSLRPAAAMPRFDTRELLIRKVHPDSHVRLGGGAYSVPPKLTGRMVHVRIQRLVVGEEFEVIHAGNVIPQHRLKAPGARVTLPSHQAAIRAASRRPASPRSERKGFRQVPGDGGPYPAAPVVQTRSLAEYESLLESA